MRLHYFIDSRYNDRAGRFLPIGIWVHNPVDGAVDFYYPDQESEEYWDAMFVINRLVESDLKAPPDFLEFHQGKAGYRGMRSRIFEEETDLTYDEFMRKTLERFIDREDSSGD